MIIQHQYKNPLLAGWYNVGPDECDCVTTGELVDIFCSSWGHGTEWINKSEPGAPHEANFLKLDCAKLKTALGWRPHWCVREAIDKTVEWTKVWLSGGNIPEEMDREIRAYVC